MVSRPVRCPGVDVVVVVARSVTVPATTSETVDPLGSHVSEPAPEKEKRKHSVPVDLRLLPDKYRTVVAQEDGLQIMALRDRTLPRARTVQATWLLHDSMFMMLILW